MGEDIKGDILCDLHDIKRQAEMHNFGMLPKDNDGSEISIMDCIDNCISQVERL